MDNLHNWLASYLAPDPAGDGATARNADSGGSSGTGGAGSEGDGFAAALDRLHDWASSYLAPPASDAATDQPKQSR